MNDRAVKFVAGTDPDDGIIEGLAIPFDGPVKGGRDLKGDRFTPNTDFHLDYFDTRPVLYGHGVSMLGATQIGKQTEIEMTDAGLWATVVLDRSGRYWKKIRELIDKGVLYFSSAAMPHLARKDSEGNITSWPFMELTLTETPANPLAVVASKMGVPMLEDGDAQKAQLSADQMTEELQAIYGMVYEIRDDVKEMRERITFLEQNEMSKSSELPAEEADDDEHDEPDDQGDKGDPAGDEAGEGADDTGAGAEAAQKAFFALLESIVNEQEEYEYAQHSPH